MLLNFTDLTSVKAFWPDVLNEFPSAQLDDQLTLYILRAEYLINRLGTVNLAADNAVNILQMACNLLTRRLIYMDKHPAYSAEPANVSRESSSGLSYGINKEPRTLEQLLGDEVVALLTLGGIVVLADMSILKTSEVVFEEAFLEIKDKNGNNIRLFQPWLDDRYQNLSDISRFPYRYWPRNKLFQP